MKKGKYSYFVEKTALETTERPREFLEGFAAGRPSAARVTR